MPGVCESIVELPRFDEIIQRCIGRIGCDFFVCMLAFQLLDEWRRLAFDRVAQSGLSFFNQVLLAGDVGGFALARL